MKINSEKPVRFLEELKMSTPTKLPNFTEEELYSIAFRSYSSGRYADAEAFFRLLSTLDPFRIPYWMGLAGALQMQKKYIEAADTYGAAALLEETETDPLPHAHAAECFFSSGEMTRARIALKSAQTIAQKEKKYDALLQQL